MTLRIAMWSGPRNLSTAMMRSFIAAHLRARAGLISHSFSS